MSNSFTFGLNAEKIGPPLKGGLLSFLMLFASIIFSSQSVNAQCPSITAIPAGDTLCSGTITSISFSSDQPGTTYTWTSNQTDVVGATDGNGATIADTLTTTDVIPGSVVYTITPTANGCTGAPITVTIIVNPVPIVTATPSSQSICTGGTTNISISADVAGTTFSWIVTQSGTSGASNGNGTTINQTLSLTNPNSNGVATYNITPLANGCFGYTIFVPVNVRKLPTVAVAPSAQTICSGSVITNIVITNPNNVAGTTFSWTRDNNVNLTGIAASGSGSPITGSLTNNTGVSQTTTFTVTATANTCSSTSTTATVTVGINPILVTHDQTVCSPNTVDLTAVVVTAGSTPGLTFSYYTNASATIVYPTPTTATAGTYYIVGASGLGCADTAAVVVTINPAPTVITTPQSVCSPGTVDLTDASVTAGSTPGLIFTYYTDAAATILYPTPTAATTGTYYIVGTFGSGCADTTPVTVTVDSTPLLITHPQSVCAPATTVDLTDPSVTAGSDPGLTFSYYTDAAATIVYPTPTMATTGTYYIVGTFGSGCSDTASVIVSINAQPTLITHDPAAACSPSTVDLTAPAVTAGSTFGLTFSYYTDAAATTLYPTPNSATAGTYYIVGTSASGCSDTASVTVTINSAPTVVTHPQSACAPATVDLTAAVVTAGSTGGLTFTYYTNAAATVVYGTPTTATSGTYYIVGTMGGTGCADTTSVIVTISAQPTLTIHDPAAVCSPSTVNITVPAITAGSTGGLTYSYYTDAAATNPYATPTAATTGTYYIVGTTAGGCSDTAAVNVTVTSKPTVITTPQVICSPATSVDLTAASVTAGSTPGLTYSYYTNATATNVYGTPATATAGTYYIVGSLMAGCTDTTAVTVTVNPAPTVITNNQTVCSPATVDLTNAAVTLGSTGGLSYTYFTDASATTPYLTPTMATAGTYYIVGRTAAGCYDTASVIVTVNTTPTVVTVPQSACSPSTINLTLPGVTAGSTPGQTFTYYTDAAATNPYLTPTHATAGTYYIVGSLGGCADTTPVTVTINPKPTVITNNPAAVCSPATVDLTDVGVTAGSTAGLTYSYYTDSAATSSYGTPTTASSGIYYIVGVDINGCSDTTPVTVTVFPKPTVVTTPQTACSPATVNLTSGAVTAGSTGGLSYSYYTDASATTPYATPSTATTGTYYIVGTSLMSGCSDTASVTVTINPSPTVIVSDPLPLCAPATVDITDPALVVGSDPGLTYTYFNDPGATNPVASPTTIASSGTYYIVGTNGFGCRDIQSVNVVIHPKPTVVTVPLSLCTADSVNLMDPLVTSGSTPGLTYTYFTDPGATTPYLTPDSAGAGTYYIVGTDGNGCSDTSSVTVDSLPVVVTIPILQCYPDTTTDLSSSITTGTSPNLSYTYYTDALATMVYPTPGNAVAGTYYIVGATVDGCTDTATTTFTVNPKPDLITNDPAPVCSPATIDLTIGAITFGSDPGLAFSYFTNAAATISYNTPTVATNGTYYIVGTLPSGCSDTASVTVTVTAQPNLITHNQSACLPTTTIDLTDSIITAGSDTSLILGYFTDALATSPYLTPTAATAGTYYIQGTIPGGCSVIQPITFTVNAKPTVTTHTQTVCAPGTINLTAAAVTSGSTGSLTYTYYTDSLATSVYPTPTTADSGTYYIVGTTIAGCSDTTAVLADVEPAPNLVTVPQSVCSPATTLDLTLPSVTAGSDSALTFTYFTDPGATSPYGTPTAATPGTYYIVATSGATCKDTASVTFTINPKPTVITNPAAICTPDSTFDLTQASVTVGSTPGLALSYYSNAAATIPYLTPTVATAGTYYIVGVTASGCADTTGITLTVNPKPTVIITDPPNVCSPATADLTLASVTLGSTGSLTYTYFTDSAATSVYATPSVATSGTYYIVGTTVAGCSDTSAVVVTSDSIPTVITTPQGACLPSVSVDLTDSLVTAGSTSGLTFSYYTDANATSIYPSPTAATAGTYYIVGTTAGGCSDTASVTVTIDSKPTVTTVNQTTCTAPTVDLTDPSVTAGSTPGLTYTYYSDSLATVVYPSPAAADSGTYYIVGTTLAGCSDTATVVVTINPVPNVITSPLAVCPPATFVDLTDSSVTAGSTSGLFYSYFSDSTATTVYLTPTAATTGTYYIVGTIAGGCSDTAAVNVNVGIAPTVITNNQTICIPDTAVDLTDSAVTLGSSAGLTFSYYTDAGATAVFPTPAAAGPGFYYIVGTNPDGCTDTAQVLVNISPSPTVITTDQSACSPITTADLTDPDATAGSSIGLIFSYYTDSLATLIYGTPTLATAGIYYIVGTSAAGCSDTAAVAIIINPKPAVVALSQTICSPGTIDLTDSSVTVGSTAGLNFDYYTDSLATALYPTPTAADSGVYYIVGTSIFGCSDTAAVAVNVVSSPILVVNDPSPTCSPATIDLTDSSITAGSTLGLSFSYYVDSMATIIYPTPTSADSGTYYIVGSLSGCSDTVAVHVTIFPKPLLSTTSQSLCLAAAVDLTDPSVTTGSTPGLTFGYYTDSAATIVYGTPTAATSGTYYIVGISADGCSDTASVDVTLSATVLTTPQTTCAPATVDLTDPTVTAGSSGGLIFTYYTDSTATTVYPTPTTASNGTYYIVGSTIDGCHDTTAVVVTINPAPTVVTNAPAAVCSPATADLTLPAITAGSTAGLTYTYYTNSSATTVYATPTTASAGTYYIVGVTGAGCADTTAITITINSSPSLVITNPPAVCSPSTVDITAASVTAGSTPGLTFSYYTNANATTVYATPTNATSGTYYIVGALGSGCSDTASVLVTINPKPTVVTIPQALCSPDSITNLTSPLVTAGSTAGLTYSYYTDSTATSVFATPNTAGAGTYYIVGTTGLGCSDTTAVTVTVNPKPTLVTTNPPAVCSPATVDITDSTITAGSTTGLGLFYFSNAACTFPYFTPSTATAGTYYIVGFTLAGCSDTASVTVTVNSSPTVVTTAQVVCVPDTVDLTLPAVTAGSTAGLVYSYYTDANATITYATPTNATTGTYYIVGSNGSCADTTPVSVTINPIPTVVTTPQSACAPGTVDLTDSLVTAGSTPGLTYTYFIDSLATTPYPTPTTADSGTYYIVGIIGGGCSDTASVTVTINPKPTVVTNNPSAVCSPATVDITLPPVTTGSTPGLTFTYYTDSLATTVYGTPTVSVAGVYYIVGTTGFGCSDTAAVTVTVDSTPTVVTTPQFACFPATVDLTLAGVTSGSTTGLTYSYYTDSLATSLLGSPNSVTSGTYYIVGASLAGCSDTTAVLVTIDSAPVVLVTDPLAVCAPATVDITDSLVTQGSTPGLTFTYYTDAAATISLATPNSVSTNGTYYIVGTSGGGCADTASVNVTINAVPIVATAPQNICEPDSIVDLTQAGVTLGSSPGLTFTYYTDAAATLPYSTPDSAAAGTYYIVGTNISGCSDTTSVTVTQNPKPIVLTVNPAPVCAPSTVDLTLPAVTAGSTAGLTFTYFTDSLATLVYATPTTADSGTYYVVGTSLAGCSDTTSVLVTIIPAPSVIVSGTNLSCFNSCDGQAIAVASGGNPFYSYSWSSGQSTDSTYAVTDSLMSICAGSYTITVTDSNGCSAMDSIIITEPAQINANVTTTDVSCNGLCNGIAISHPSAGTAPYTFAWSTGSIDTLSNNLCTGTYTVIVTDSGGCQVNVPFNISSVPPVVANAAVADASCGLCNGQVSLAPSGGTAPYTFLWGDSSSTNTLNNLCSGLYTVNITDSTGCSTNISIPISNPGGVSDVSIVSTNVSCYGLCDGNISSVTPIGGTAPYSFLWIPTGDTTSVLSNICAGTYFVQVQDANGCSFIDSVTINQPAQMSVNPFVTAASCGVCDGGVTIVPTGGQGTIAVSWNTGSTSDTLTSICAGLYTAQVTDSVGCIQSIIVPVPSQTGPALSISSTGPSCSSACDATATVVASGGISPYTYLWNDPTAQNTDSAVGLCAGTYFVQVTGGTCVSITQVTIANPGAIGFGFATTVDPSCNGTTDGSIAVIPSGGTLPYSYSWSTGSNGNNINNLAAGSYTVTVTDANGCTGTQTNALTDPTSLSITDSITNASCNTTPDGAIDITVMGGTPGYTYQWNSPGNQTTQDISNILSGTYTVVVTDSNGCVLSDTLTVISTVTVTASAGNDTSFCMPGNVLLDASGSSANTTTFQWFEIMSPTDSLVGSTQVTSVAAVSGTTSYYVIASNGAGCAATDTIVVTANAGPLVDAGADVSIIGGSSTVLGGNPTGPAGSTYVWNPSTYLDNPTSSNPTANPLTTTSYTVTVTSAQGCVSTDVIVVSASTAITFPNGISPNGDGANDEWIIDNIELFPECVVEIYNRWGELLFMSKGYTDHWKGIYKGQLLPVGTYYYIINLNNPLFPDPFTGPITILR